MAYNPDLMAYKVTMADLKAEVPVDKRIFLLLGATAINDSINGLFRFDASSLATPDDVDVVKPDSILLANAGRYIRMKLGGATIGRASVYNDSNVTFVANTLQAITFNQNESVEGYISHSTSTNPTRINALKDGFVLIVLTAQVLKGGAGSGTMYFWLRKNGVNVANSARKFDSSNNDTRFAVYTKGLGVVAGDYIEIISQADTANFSLQAIAAAGSIPSVPSAIAAVFIYNPFPA